MNAGRDAPTRQDFRDPGAAGAAGILVAIILVLLLCAAMALVAWRG